jgi:ATP-dependent DNA helicase RecQ
MTTDTPESVLAAAHALASVPASELPEHLQSLRLRYRSAPHLFSTDTLTLLNSYADRARQATGEQDRLRALEALKDIFGYTTFRSGQAAIIEAVMAGRDCVGVMPTGAGKSVTYQIPARLLGGLTLVISPLISLMKDQVDAMTGVGIRATFLNSSLDAQQRTARIAGLMAGDYELLYAAPEGIDASVGRLLDALPLRLIAVDEAHCISEWGHDFRPSYRNLSGLKQRFKGLPILALTATATPTVKNDIISQLALKNPLLVRGSFYRPNLRLFAVKKGQGDGVRDMLLKLVRARAGDTGIIYCLSRKAAESTATFLTSKGIRAIAYHAGLSTEERARTQEGFSRDNIDVVCATVAFGMGIDKSNVRYVIHRDMPRSIEGYYQEIGRAGRDGAEADCVLFYSWADVLSLERLLENTEAADSAAADQQRRAVRSMFDLADTSHCLWQRLVSHFADTIDDCGQSCGQCNGIDIIGIAKPRRIQPKTRTAASQAPTDMASADLSANDSLFSALRALRKSIADERGIPAYLVFSDRSLQDMAARHPRTMGDLLAIHGVGQKKLEQYGNHFLALLRTTPVNRTP